MFNNTLSFAKEMVCCNCFGIISSRNRRRFKPDINNNLSREPLLDDDFEDDERFGNDDETNTSSGDETEVQTRPKRSEEVLNLRVENGMISRQYPVKETNKVVRTEDENGNKMINEYVRECKIGSGSYGKVALYQSSIDGKHYAIKFSSSNSSNHTVTATAATTQSQQQQPTNSAVQQQQQQQRRNSAAATAATKFCSSNNSHAILQFSSSSSRIWRCSSGSHLRLGE